VNETFRSSLSLRCCITTGKIAKKRKPSTSAITLPPEVTRDSREGRDLKKSAKEIIQRINLF